MVLTAFGLALPACGIAAAPAHPKPPATSASAAGKPAPAAAPAASPLTFTFDFIPNGEYVPYYAALARGYYRARGLDVRFQQAPNPAAAIQGVANGKTQLSACTAGVAAQAITKGAPIKVVATVMQLDPYGLIYPASHPVKHGADLYGKTVGVPAGTDAAVTWKAFAAVHHLDVQRIKVVNASPLAQAGLMRKGAIAAFSGAQYTFAPIAKTLHLPVGFLPYADSGVQVYGECIVTSDRMLTAHPGEVRGFLRATRQGYLFAVAHPRQAAGYMVSHHTRLHLATTVAQWRLTVPLLHTHASTGRSWGWQAAADWHAELSLLHRFAGMPAPLAAARYYTNGYLPGGAG